jgi:hypothetical protein
VKIIRRRGTDDFHSAHPEEAFGDAMVEGPDGLKIPHTKVQLPDDPEIELMDVPEETVDSFLGKLEAATGGKALGPFKIHDKGKFQRFGASQLAEDEFETEVAGFVVRGKKVERRAEPRGFAWGHQS